MLSSVVWVPRQGFKPDVDALVETRMESLVDGSEDGVGGEGDDRDMQEEVDVADVLAGGDAAVEAMQKALKRAGQAPMVREIEEEEKHDMVIRDRDLTLLATRSDEDASALELYIFEDHDEDGGGTNLFIHHDVFLPAFPLCLAWSGAARVSSCKSDSIAAVGTFLPNIDLWNLNDLETIEPVATLGGYVIDPRKANSTLASGGMPPLVEGSHSAAVMALSWNPLDAEYLASGSADHLVKCWDVESCHCVQTLGHHKGKVQAVDWHSHRRGLLLTAGFDSKAFAVDARSSGDGISFELQSEVESASWKHFVPDTDQFLVTTEDGHFSCFDCRNNAAPLWRVRAHSDAVSGFAISPVVPGLVATGSTDREVKLWNANTDGEPTMLGEKTVGVGSVFGLSFVTEKDNPFLLAAVGSGGKLSVVDTALVFASVRNQFSSLFPEVTARAARNVLLETPENGLQEVEEDSEEDESEESDED